PPEANHSAYWRQYVIIEISNATIFYDASYADDGCAEPTKVQSSYAMLVLHHLPNHQGYRADIHWDAAEIQYTTIKAGERKLVFAASRSGDGTMPTRRPTAFESPERALHPISEVPSGIIKLLFTR